MISIELNLSLFTLDQCNPSPCLNNGECISQQHVGPPSCFCGKSYSGLICEEGKKNI